MSMMATISGIFPRIKRRTKLEQLERKADKTLRELDELATERRRKTGDTIVPGERGKTAPTS